MGTTTGSALPAVNWTAASSLFALALILDTGHRIYGADEIGYGIRRQASVLNEARKKSMQVTFHGLGAAPEKNSRQTRRAFYLLNAFYRYGPLPDHSLGSIFQRQELMALPVTTPKRTDAVSSAAYA